MARLLDSATWRADGWFAVLRGPFRGTKVPRHAKASWPLFSSGKFPVLQVSSLAWVTGPKLKDRKFWVIYRTGPDGVWATNDYVAAGWLCLLYYHVVMLCFISYCISYPHILWCYHPWQHPCEEIVLKIPRKASIAKRPRFGRPCGELFSTPSHQLRLQLWEVERTPIWK